MYISELFTVIGYLHTAGLRTADELIVLSEYVGLHYALIVNTTYNFS